MPGAEARTAALAKIGGGASLAHGDLTMDAAKGAVFRSLRRCSLCSRVPLRNPRDADYEVSCPPDFGGAHRSDPRLHVRIDSLWGNPQSSAFPRSLGRGPCPRAWHLGEASFRWPQGESALGGSLFFKPPALPGAHNSELRRGDPAGRPYELRTVFDYDP